MEMIAEDFNLDFRVTVTPDRLNDVMKIEDSFGAFIPVPLLQWQRIVDERLWPEVLHKTANIEIEDRQRKCYQQAIYLFCHRYEHTYIGLN